MTNPLYQVKELLVNDGCEAIILAGGLGTRLRDAVPELPKVMAPVNGKPFISYLIDYLRMQGVRRIVFSLGYKWAVIQEYLEKEYPTLDHTIVIEDEPLGTGGAIMLALSKITGQFAIIANGDTLFKVNLQKLITTHLEKQSRCTLALKPMNHFDRYGVVELDDNNRIISFKEKSHYASGTINGGVICLDKQHFISKSWPDKFSFEQDFLEAYFKSESFFGDVQDEYFIDIGIPEDYNRAQVDLKQNELDLQRVDTSWTLFLDRDGVINEETVGEYVKHWGEFVFSKGVLAVFKQLSEKFHRIIIISNQRGVGKGLMSLEDLTSIHFEMQREVKIVGGKIDQIYYCTEKEEHNYFRKPNPGMAFRAKMDYPDIDFSKSIMVGNKPSDMKFGRAAGMKTVFLTTTNPNQPFPHPDIDRIFDTLESFAAAL